MRESRWPPSFITKTHRTSCLVGLFLSRLPFFFCLVFRLVFHLCFVFRFFFCIVICFVFCFVFVSSFVLWPFFVLLFVSSFVLWSFFVLLFVFFVQYLLTREIVSMHKGACTAKAYLRPHRWTILWSTYRKIVSMYKGACTGSAVLQPASKNQKVRFK